MQWSDVAQDSDFWLALVNVVLKPRWLQSECKLTVYRGNYWLWQSLLLESCSCSLSRSNDWVRAL